MFLLVCLEGVQNVPVITPRQKAKCYESNKVLVQLISNPTLSPIRVWLRERESVPCCNCDHTESSKKKMEVTLENSIFSPGKLSTQWRDINCLLYLYVRFEGENGYLIAKPQEQNEIRSPTWWPVGLHQYRKLEWAAKRTQTFKSENVKKSSTTYQISKKTRYLGKFFKGVWLEWRHMRASFTRLNIFIWKHWLNVMQVKNGRASSFISNINLASS